jgi:hypothetical protein
MARPGFATLVIGWLAVVLIGCGEAQSQPIQPGSAASEYVRRSGTADLFEIQTGNLAPRKSEREDIRALARMLPDDRTHGGEASRGDAEDRSHTDRFAAAGLRLLSARQPILRSNV